MLVVGVNLQARPRTDEEDRSAWRVIAAAMFFIGTGAAIRFVKLHWALSVGFLAAYVGPKVLGALFLLLWLLWAALRDTSG